MIPQRRFGALRAQPQPLAHRPRQPKKKEPSMLKNVVMQKAPGLTRVSLGREPVPCVVSPQTGLAQHCGGVGNRAKTAPAACELVILLASAP